MNIIQKIMDNVSPARRAEAQAALEAARKPTREERRAAKLAAPYTAAPPLSDGDKQRMTGLAIIFGSSVKHQRCHFPPNVPIAFEDPDARPYFLAAGWATPTDRAPELYYPATMFDIDPDTRHADGPNKGRPVLGG